MHKAINRNAHFSAAGVSFLLIELDLAITFCKSGLITSNPAHAQQNADRVRSALRTVVRMQDRISLTQQEKDQIEAKTAQATKLFAQLEHSLSSHTKSPRQNAQKTSGNRA
jgi:septal ring factor EnvC (AmiA/AmiB activator)